MEKNNLLDHPMMEKDISELPEFLQLAIKHERKCIKARIQQAENYIKRIELMMGGVDYYETFKTVPIKKGYSFPDKKYKKKKHEFLSDWDEHEKK